MQSLAGVQQPVIKAVLVMNHEGKRICARFCDRVQWGDLESQRAFEMSLMRKMQTSGEFPEVVDVMEFGEFLVAFKPYDDINIFVVGGSDENELILAEVLTTLDEALNVLLRGQIYESAILESLMSLLLVVDELVDAEGVIMESDPTELAARVGSNSGGFMDNVPIGEQTLSQALQSARDQITRSILS